MLFTGTGTPRAGGAPTTFSALGRDLGLVGPIVPTWESTGLFYMRYFSAGFFFRTTMGSAGNTSTPGDPALGAQVSPSGFSLFELGGELNEAIPFRPFTLFLGVRTGYRTIGVPIESFATITCHATSGSPRMPVTTSYPCQPSASVDSLVISPRLQLDYAPFGASGFVEFGLYASADLVPNFGLSGGAALTFRGFPHWAMQ
jgi:hypothetical protein